MGSNDVVVEFTLFSDTIVYRLHFYIIFKTIVTNISALKVLQHFTAKRFRLRDKDRNCNS